MLKFANILQNIFESPDMVYRKGYLHAVSFHESDSYPFAFYNGEVYLGRQRSIHSQLCKDNSLNKSDLKYSGRLWKNENIISFWEYPKTNSEMREILNKIKNKFKEQYNIDINLNKLMIEVVIDIVDNKIVTNKPDLALAALEIEKTDLEISKRNFSVYSKNRFRNLNISLGDYDTNKEFK